MSYKRDAQHASFLRSKEVELSLCCYTWRKLKPKVAKNNEKFTPALLIQDKKQ